MTYPVLSLREPKSDLKATLREEMQAESQFCQEVNMGNVEEYTRSLEWTPGITRFDQTWKGARQ